MHTACATHTHLPSRYLAHAPTQRAEAAGAAALAAKQRGRRKAAWLAREAEYPDASEADYGYERAMDFLVDVHLIGRCDGFVGKFSSNRGRVGYELMAARPPFSVRPYVSLDIPWCFGLACRKEGNEELKRGWRQLGRAGRGRRSNRGRD